MPEDKIENPAQNVASGFDHSLHVVPALTEHLLGPTATLRLECVQPWLLCTLTNEQDGVSAGAFWLCHLKNFGSSLH